MVDLIFYVHCIIHTLTFFGRQSCNLGRHVPMAKSMRNGILRIGQKYASKVESEQVDSWFSDINELPEAAKIKVFAQVCKAYVGELLKIYCSLLVYPDGIHVLVL